MAEPSKPGMAASMLMMLALASSGASMAAGAPRDSARGTVDPRRERADPGLGSDTPGTAAINTSSSAVVPISPSSSSSTK
eukprot:438272-Prorocentrum_minimum.AAC.1